MNIAQEEVRRLVNEVAIENGCPTDRLDDVWAVVSSLELPMTKRHLEDDVLFALSRIVDKND